MEENKNISQFMEYLDNPLYTDKNETLSLIHEMINSYIEIVDAWIIKAYFSEISRRDIKLLMMERYVVPYFIKHGEKDVIELFKEIIKKYEISPSLREVKMRILDSEEFLLFLLNLLNYVQYGRLSAWERPIK